ncbi:unnamed protein product [Bursaphelenchus xylophilus]|uniref:(pine wood nematode) hypothetical protein n=1 Tax=Bursaphelenchus xylophilus TaxID=6326 RepID=A0A1I7RMB7_BURXY|nr:unnamed protein product [Bursaphelenchus xylophilus]CAG9118361.1 unnamed protein product [Bursaphelenchus xylophilus]
MEAEETYKFLRQLLPLIEFTCGIFSFFFNVVYGVRFWKFRQFHENLRKSILLLNFVISFSPILHPLAIYTSNDNTPLLHGNYREAAICLRRLKRNANTQRHNSFSLSERFELRQTEMVTKVMLPLNFCYMATLFAQLVPACLCAKLTFGAADAEWWRIYEVSVLYCYACVGMYNLVATVYTFRSMRAMKRPGPKKIRPLTANDETDKYFAQLENQWSTVTKNNH